MRGGNCIIKLDMTKAYDRVEWDFLQAVLHCFGFSDSFYRLIHQCTNKNCYSISFIGSLQGYFSSSRCLRQGDPMSPALFILTQEVLSRDLKAAIQTGQILPYHTANSDINTSHSIYANDTLLFTNGGLISLGNLMGCISKYEGVSGQSINKSKSNFIMGMRYLERTQAMQQLRVSRFSSFRWTTLVPLLLKADESRSILKALKRV